MDKVRKKWLPHLTEKVVADAKGYNLDSYVIALEGWRRGLTLTWHAKESKEFPNMRTWFVDTPGRLFSLSNAKKTHYFFRSRGDLVTNEAVDIGKDKEKTKKYIATNNIPIPEGKQFHLDSSYEEVRKYVSYLGFPVVIKPVDGSFGRGVFTNIQTKEELEYALVYLHKELKYKDVIVERYVAGDEYRIYVVGDKVVGAINRIPANVVGDGINTIENLIIKKNKERSKNPRLVSCPIEIDYDLEVLIDKKGYSLDSIPQKGEQVFLSDKSNISLGGDPIDVLDQLSTTVKNTAINALHAIPGLEHGAIDLIVKESNPDEVGAILEVNPTAQIGSILFPMQGKARDVPAAIIDYYFPETADRKRSNIYFNFKEVLEPLYSKAAVRTTVTTLSTTSLYTKQVVFKIDNAEHMEYGQNIKEKAKKCNIHGFISKTENKLTLVIASFEELQIERFLKEIKDRFLKESVVVEENSYDLPVKLGFEMDGDKSTLIEQLKQLQNEKESLKLEIQKLEKKYTDMLNSRLWKMTKPLRETLDFIKGK